MTYHINQWLNKTNNPKNYSRACAGFWGWQRGEFDDVWDVHKSGYDRESLTNLLLRKNFTNIQSLEGDSTKHLHLKCNKY
jgi:hypothetical protein